MRANEVTHLFEMPQRKAGTIDWRLSDDVMNRCRAGVLLARNSATILTHAAGKLIEVSDPQGGQFAFISAETGLIDYYMQYRTRGLPELGHCATQIKIWRRSGLGFPQLTSYVFYEIMLNRFDTMVSDREQFDDGIEFWVNRLGESAAANRWVGLIDNGVVHSFDPAKSGFQAWLKACDGWGEASRYQELLFFISSLPRP